MRHTQLREWRSFYGFSVTRPRVVLPCFGQHGDRRPWRGLQWRMLQNCKDRESDTLSMASEIAKFIFEAQA